MQAIIYFFSLLISIFAFEGGRKFETRIERKENEFMMIDKLKMDQKKIHDFVIEVDLYHGNIIMINCSGKSVSFFLLK